MNGTARFAPLIPIAVGASAVVVGTWAVRDYRAWRSLGPGGLPHTLCGWLQMTRWRMIMDDPFSTEPLLPLVGTDDGTRAIASLSRREGGRPRIAPHPVPHRQLDQHAPDVIRSVHQAMFDDYVKGSASTLHYAPSHFEKHNKGSLHESGFYVR